MLQFKKIKSIRRKKKKVKVYNFDVPEYENYIANGIVVHNCQNFSVSQSLPPSNNKIWAPHELLICAESKKTRGIAFTYNEPSLQYEFLQEIILNTISRASDMRFVMKTSGFINIPIIRDLGTIFDAFNIDIKGNNEDYQKVCGASWGPVKNSIETLVKMKVHLEISYLVLPSRVNDTNFHIYIRDWLSDLSPSIPVHILYFYPFYKMTNSYEISDLIPIYDLFQKKMEYVYMSNVFDNSVVEYRNTICPNCGSNLIDRTFGVAKELFKTECSCGYRIKGVFK